MAKKIVPDRGLEADGVNEISHCDAYIGRSGASKYLRWYLLINRLPATEKFLAEEMGVVPKLFADFEGKRVQVVMASRLGDVGITEDLKTRYGYTKRVLVHELTNFNDIPLCWPGKKNKARRRGAKS